MIESLAGPALLVDLAALIAGPEAGPREIELAV